MSNNKSFFIFIPTICMISCFSCSDDKKIEPGVIPCLADNTCADASRVCINDLYCVPRCTPDSCDPGFVCAASGICTKQNAQDPTKPQCSQEVPCTDSNLHCVGGKCVPKSSGAACSGTQKCDKSNFYCVNGQCLAASATTSCGDDTACPDTQYCDNGHCADHCASSDGCTDHRECDPQTGKCVERCFLKGCPDGMACNNNGLCVVGDCTSWQRCYENGFDQTYVCDVPNFKCIKKCSEGSCGTGKYCDSDDSLCHDGECSEIDACTGTKVCDLSSHTCIEKCTSDAACGGLLCDSDGRCVEPCATGTCRKGKVCDPDTNLCIEAECSPLDGCPQSYQVCDKGHCVDRCTMSGAKCSENAVCDAASGLCIPKCTAESCQQEGQVCGNEGRCVDGECSIIEPCADPSMVCSADYKCVTPKNIKNDCYFYSTCASQCDGSHEKDCNDCRSKSKWCEEGKQCNAYNECIDSSSADGLGLGIACDDAVAGKSCASGLYCDSKQKVCLQDAYKVQGTSCTAGSYADHCEGNLIVECSEYYSQVMVYDCKTYYVDWDMGTNASFYGDDFVCAKQPGTNYVACAQQCAADDVTAKSTRYVCSRDLDDFDAEYSNSYLCKYNEEGISAYYYEQSKECWNGCSLEDGTCDND